MQKTFLFIMLLCTLGVVRAQVVTPPAGSAGAIIGPPGGSLGCIQLYATATTLAGCVTTPAKLGTADPGFTGEVFVIDSATTTTAAFTQFVQEADLNLTADEVAQKVIYSLTTNFNGTHNYEYDIANQTIMNFNGTGKAGVSATLPLALFNGQMNLIGTVTDAWVTDFYAQTTSVAGNVDLAANFWGTFTNVSGTMVKVANVYFPAISNGGTITALYGMWSDAQGGLANQYFPEWYDEAGVWVIHSTNAFNAVYQARPALYNPQFTKFSIAQLNANSYERGVCQWESNVYVCTTEAGAGGGTLRAFQLGDAGVSVTFGGLLTNHSVAFAALGTPANGTQYYCSDCTVTSGIDDTCKATGNGAKADRINGAWKCAQ